MMRKRWISATAVDAASALLLALQACRDGPLQPPSSAFARPQLGQIDYCSLLTYEGGGPGFSDAEIAADVCRAIQEMGYDSRCLDYVEWLMDAWTDGRMYDYESTNTNEAGKSQYNWTGPGSPDPNSEIGIATTFANSLTGATWQEDLPLTVRHEMSHVWYNTNDTNGDPGSGEYWAYDNCWNH